MVFISDIKELIRSKSYEELILYLEIADSPYIPTLGEKNKLFQKAKEDLIKHIQDILKGASTNKLSDRELILASYTSSKESDYDRVDNCIIGAIERYIDNQTFSLSTVTRVEKKRTDKDRAKHSGDTRILMNAKRNKIIKEIAASFRTDWPVLQKAQFIHDNWKSYLNLEGRRPLSVRRIREILSNPK